MILNQQYRNPIKKIKKLTMGGCIGKSQKYKVAIICGSLRQHSCNKSLLTALVDTQHSQLEFFWINIINFPIFDEDIEGKGIPEDVEQARKLIYQADAVLFGVAEYNFTVSSPLKNAYDWLSRQYSSAKLPWNVKSPMQQKIGAMTSVGGEMGGGRAQKHFLQCVQFRKMKMLPGQGAAQMKIKRWAGNYFDETGKIISNQIFNKLTPFLNAFALFIKNNLKTK